MFISLLGTYLGVVLLSYMLTMLMLLMSCLRRVYQRSHRFTPKLSSKSFVLLSLTFRSMIHSDLIFVLWCEVRVQLHSFLCRYPYVPVPFVKKTFLSLLKCLGIFVKNQQTLSERIYFCTFQFYSIDLSCLYFYQYHSLDYWSFVVHFESKSMSSPISSFFKTVLAIPYEF